MELRLIQSPGNNRGRLFVLWVTAALDTVTQIVTVRPVDWPVSQDRRDPMHPKERRSAATRREFLARTGGAAFALSGASGLLAACSNPTTTAGSTVNSAGQKVGPGGLPLARPNRRVTLPLWEQPIPSGLKPQTGGEFTTFNYPDYIYGALRKAFGKEYDVTVQVRPCDAITSGAAELAAGAVQPDVAGMAPDNLDRLVAGYLCKPVNLDYIPNLKKN